MSNSRLSTKQNKVKFYNTLPRKDIGKLGDIVVSVNRGQKYFCIKDVDGWKYSKLNRETEFSTLKIDNLKVSGSSTLSGTVNFKRDLRTPGDIYLRNSKIYFDMNATTPNDYITGGLSDLEFYTNGVKQFELTTSAALVTQDLELSEDLKLPATKKLYLDGGGDTYITSSTDNELNFYAGSGLGATNILNLASASVTILKALTLSTIDAITSDTDKILVSHSGVIKYVTGDTLLPDILTAGTNCTLSGAILNVDDAFITNNAVDIMDIDDFGANAAFTIDADQPATTAAEDSIGLWVDYRRQPAISGTAAHNDVGILLNTSAATLGTGTVKGMDINVSGDTTGTHDAIGVDIAVLGAGNSNLGMLINSTGTHMKLVSSANANDYFTIAVGAEGATTISTVDADTTVGHLTFDVDGDIKLDAAGNDIVFMAAGVSHGLINFIGDNLLIKAATDYILTLESQGTGNIVLDSADDIELNADGGNIIFKDASVKMAEIDSKGIRSYSGSVYMNEVANAAADSAAQGQLWTKDDDPQTLMFTDGGGTDYNILRPTSTAVWGGNFARVGASGTHYAIPTGHLATNIGLGTSLSPATTLTCGTNADDITTCVWFSLNAIKVIACTIMTGEGGGTNTAHTCTLMRYDIDADGDWSSGTIVGNVANISSDDYSHARKHILSMSGTAANLLVSTSQVLVGTVEMVSAYNSTSAAKVVLQYQEVQ
jgi:hypothetical protein